MTTRPLEEESTGRSQAGEKGQMSAPRPKRRPEGSGLGLLEVMVLGVLTVVLSVSVLAVAGWDLLPLAVLLVLLGLALVLLVVQRLEREPAGQDGEDDGRHGVAPPPPPGRKQTRTERSRG